MITKDELEKLISEGKNTKECQSIFKISKRELTKLRKLYGLERKYLEFTTNCGFCGKSHTYTGLKEKEVYFCNIKCSVSIRKHSDETKKKISDKLKNTLKSKFIKKEKFCLKCNKDMSDKKNKKFCSRSCSMSFHNNLRRKELSDRRIEYLQNSNIKWFDTYNTNGKLIKVQGKWEVEFALSCNRLGINYDRKSVNINEYNKYTPDFYLPDLDLYVEIKGYLYEKDKYKMLKAIEYSEIDLRIIFDINRIKNLNFEDLLKIEKVKDIMNYDDIDFNKFTVRF